MCCFSYLIHHYETSLFSSTLKLFLTFYKDNQNTFLKVNLFSFLYFQSFPYSLFETILSAIVILLSEVSVIR